MCVRGSRLEESSLCAHFISWTRTPSRARALYLDACKAQQTGHRADTDELLCWETPHILPKEAVTPLFQPTIVPSFKLSGETGNLDFYVKSSGFQNWSKYLKQCHGQKTYLWPPGCHSSSLPSSRYFLPLDHESPKGRAPSSHQFHPLARLIDSIFSPVP